MAVTLYSGFSALQRSVRPWSAPGDINALLDKLRTNLQLAACCRNNLDVTIYPTTAYSSTVDVYMPPLLGTNYCPMEVRVSSVTDISAFYLYAGGTSYTQSKSASAWNSVYATNTKYVVPWVRMVAGATTTTRFFFRARQDSYIGTYGTPSGIRRMPGLTPSTPLSPSSICPTFPLADNGGVNSGEYNAFIDAARKCGELPVLQSGATIISGTQTWPSGTWSGITFPVCLDPQGPAAQKVLTLVYYTQASGLTELRCSFGHGAWTGTLARTNRANNICEYRCNLTRMLETVPPDYAQNGRQYWYCHVDYYPSTKGTDAIYCWSAWTGVPEGPLS